MFDDDRREAIEKSQKVLLSELESILPKKDVTRQAMALLKDRANDFTAILDDLNNYVADAAGDSETISKFFNKTDLIPTGFMIMAGGRISANITLGVGGSATLALIVLPYKILKTNKITKKVTSYYAFKRGVVAIPVANVGIGYGGASAVRAGIGQIWGHVEEPGDFTGTAVGISGNIAAGIGNNFKLLFLLGLNGVKNTFATASWQLGSVEASFHVNVGPVLSIKTFVDTLKIDEDGNASTIDGVIEEN